ncbi:MAG: hypothetical protein ACYCSN_19670 [Acidobacteriaceae bacterium]
MANTLIPLDERNLTPEQVDALDRRRSRGHVCLVIGFLLLILATVQSLWAGQDLTYSPPWIHPFGYYEMFDLGTAFVLIVTGIAMRRGRPEFTSR